MYTSYVIYIYIHVDRFRATSIVTYTHIESAPRFAAKPQKHDVWQVHSQVAGLVFR